MIQGISGTPFSTEYSSYSKFQHPPLRNCVKCSNQFFLWMAKSTTATFYTLCKPQDLGLADLFFWATRSQKWTFNLTHFLILISLTLNTSCLNSPPQQGKVQIPYPHGWRPYARGWRGGMLKLRIDRHITWLPWLTTATVPRGKEAVQRKTSERIRNIGQNACFMRSKK